MRLLPYLILAIALTYALTGCGRCCKYGAPVPVAVPPPSAPETLTQLLVDAENSYRASQGQTMLTQGLSCTVQAVSSGVWLSSSSPGYLAGQGVLVVTGTAYAYLMTGAFNQPEVPNGSLSSVLPASLQAMFSSINYKLSCSGQVVVIQDGYYTFDLASDDGSILTLDGAQVANNDGGHTMFDKQGVKLLRAGVHTFSLLYAQSAPSNFGLTLSANGAVLPGSAFYH